MCIKIYELKVVSDEKELQGQIDEALYVCMCLKEGTKVK